MGFRSYDRAAPLHRSARQDTPFADSAPSFVEFNDHQSASLDSLVNQPPARYLDTPHLPPASLDIHLGARRYRATSSQMLHLPLDISADVAPGRNFAMPSPTNVSLLNNFPFASPDINEPGSPLGYDLNSGILDSNLAHFSNSLLDINETADASGLNFSPSSDLNLSPQESPIFQLFTGPSLELGLPSNPDNPMQDAPSKDSPTPPPASLTLQGTPLLTPPAERAPLPDPYADLSVAGIVQQKRDDVFWAAWVFFSHYFEPVLTGGPKDLSISLERGPPDLGQQIDRQVFVVQNDIENSYMWYLSARPANTLGRMQLQSYINGRHQAGQAAFPYSSSNGFTRSHKLQRKKYKGLSNPQCIHGVRLVEAPTFSTAAPDEKRRFEELTSRPIGSPLPLEAADYNAWRKVPERADASPSADTTAAAEPLSQTIQFLPGQESREPPAKAAPTSAPSSKGGGRAAKKRRKGAGPKSGTANEEPPTGSTGEQGTPRGGGAEELLLGGGAGNSPDLWGSDGNEAGVGEEMTRLRESMTNGGRATHRTPVTDLTLRWQAEIEQGRSQMRGPCSDGAHASAAAKLRAAEQRLPLTGPGSAAAHLQREAVRSGRILPPENARLEDRSCDGTEGLESRLAGPAFGQPGAGIASQQRSRDAQLRPSNTDNLQRRGSTQTDSGQAGSELHRWGGGGPAETVSEDCPPAELTASLDGTEVSGPSRRNAPSPQAPQQPAPAVAPLGSVPLALRDLSRAQLGMGGLPRASPEALYEDEAGYLLFVSLPFTDLKQVRVTWRNVGETGIVKLEGVGPARGLARGSRVLRLSSWGRAGGDATREIMLPTRIPDDASIEAHFSAECAGLEISVPKHAACTEERSVRLFLPEQRQLPRGS